ncbi:colony stimulating factor 3 (granulocyte) a [Tachysurus fulvidraco]|uniref:colony stimulating factor 3 (granulocyte) a n=1 Tax=Tachysurus fulvidraco TaxID=1234273 RepID=UPI000F4F4D8F|nr:colony stimulating factor 3 (granulocyte) a [Tachysurus fulvidraco]
MSLLLNLLLLCSLALVSFSAPVKQHNSQPSDFKSNIQDSRSLTSKMLENIPAAHKSCVRQEFTSDPFRLEYIRGVLAIPPAPKLAPISETNTLEMNLGRISEGLQLHQQLFLQLQQLLQEQKEKVDCGSELSEILSVISELNTHIKKLQALAGFPNSKSQLVSVSAFTAAVSRDDYNLNVGFHLLLEQLRTFTQDTVRTLREIQRTNLHV